VCYWLAVYLSQELNTRASWGVQQRLAALGLMEAVAAMVFSSRSVCALSGVCCVFVLFIGVLLVVFDMCAEVVDVFLHNFDEKLLCFTSFGHRIETSCEQLDFCRLE